MSESITKELRSSAVTRGAIRIDAWDPIVVISESKRDDIADDIDERFTHELEAKQAEVDALKSDNSDLRARLDASIPLPVDADGVPWSGDDVDKPFALTDGDKATEGLVREIVYDWPREGWWIVDQYDTHYPADKCRHVASEPTDSQERIDADARLCPGVYTEKCNVGVFGTTSNFSNDVRIAMVEDLLRRQRELDGAGEAR